MNTPLDNEKENSASCIDYSPDGKYLSVATKNGKVFIYEVGKDW